MPNEQGAKRAVPRDTSKSEGGMWRGLGRKLSLLRASRQPSAHTAFSYVDLELLKVRAAHLSPKQSAIPVDLKRIANND